MQTISKHVGPPNVANLPVCPVTQIIGGLKLPLPTELNIATVILYFR